MAKVQRLTSPANGLVKQVSKAVAGGGLTPEGYCIAETFHLLEEALRSRCEIKLVLASESARARAEQCLRGRPELRLFVLPDSLSERLSATEAGQGVTTLVRPPAWTLDDVLRGRPLVVVLDGLQDPGNAGAIVRAAEAFGSSGLVFLKGSVHPYNPKAVRASAGSLFRVPILHGVEGNRVLAAAGRKKLAIYAASPAGGVPAAEADLAQACMIVVGSEGRGWRQDLWVDARKVRIPTTEVESLNAAMAAGILLYEARRQRGDRL